MFECTIFRLFSREGGNPILSLYLGRPGLEGGGGLEHLPCNLLYGDAAIAVSVFSRFGACAIPSILLDSVGGVAQFVYQYPTSPFEWPFYDPPLCPVSPTIEIQPYPLWRVSFCRAPAGALSSVFFRPGRRHSVLKAHISLFCLFFFPFLQNSEKG